MQLLSAKQVLNILFYIFTLDIFEFVFHSISIPGQINQNKHFLFLF